MIKKNEIENPFGEQYQKYWDRRYSKFSKFDEGIQTDLEGLYSVGPEEVALKYGRKVDSQIVLDGFCGIGGNVIGFAAFARHVFAIEINHNRIEMAKNNVAVYGLSDKVTFIEGDFFEEASKIKAEVVYIALPWGGPDYSKKEKFLLNDFNPNGKKILDFSFRYFSKVIMQVPKNFDVNELNQFNKKFIV